MEISHDQILNLVLDACVELLQAERSSLSESTIFTDDLEADSLDLIEVAMTIDDKLHLGLEEDDLKYVSTIGDAVTVVLRRASALNKSEW